MMNGELRRKWAKKLRQWRHEARVSQEELARRTGLSTKTISDLELEKTTPDNRTVLRYAEGLEKQLDVTELRDFWPENVRDISDAVGLWLMQCEEDQRDSLGERLLGYMLRLRKNGS